MDLVIIGPITNISNIYKLFDYNNFNYILTVIDKRDCFINKTLQHPIINQLSDKSDFIFINSFRNIIKHYLINKKSDNVTFYFPEFNYTNILPYSDTVNLHIKYTKEYIPNTAFFYENHFKYSYNYNHLIYSFITVNVNLLKNQTEMPEWTVSDNILKLEIFKFIENLNTEYNLLIL